MFSKLSLLLAVMLAAAGGLAPAGAQAQTGTVDLTVSGATRTSTCDSSNLCTVRFTVTVRNSSTATATVYGTAAGAFWSASYPLVASCSSQAGSQWNAVGTTSAQLAPGASANITVYGPGYVGSKVRKGSSLTVKFAADPCNARAESNETNNTRSVTFTI